MLSGVFEVLMALALVLSSLLYVDIFSITTNDKKEERIIVLDGPLRQPSGNQLARSQSMFSAVSSCQFWNETSLTFLLKPCRSAYFAAASTGSGVFSA